MAIAPGERRFLWNIIIGAFVLILVVWIVGFVLNFLLLLTPIVIILVLFYILYRYVRWKFRSRRKHK